MIPAVGCCCRRDLLISAVIVRPSVVLTRHLVGPTSRTASVVSASLHEEPTEKREETSPLADSPPTQLGLREILKPLAILDLRLEQPIAAR